MYIYLLIAHPYIYSVCSHTFSQDLFKRVIPHQCLGSVWSRRDKSSLDRDAASVVATVDQFNAVSFRVISTILMVSNPGYHSSYHTHSYNSHSEKENYKAAQHRSRVITKWIDIAQVRLLCKCVQYNHFCNYIK